ncbi:16S rRNA (cytosine(1402)-N(4))-methyltransferase RsmH [Candidatus Dependentiae bacterium]|nr:16S rRNA (cytosine(1402)-N(4))-methyltransferase RsmH [Candidatus Dependentiae bacterium]MBU4386961.1 16S rRNA (cytosine(1402)-N(4))-methyltransferase RsmH [Candidatus Dependentiae bacterium]MCG2756723.1 16S rRNA (cytosine(1402)-N(4))-methyltransferase RsmH [Candidatus Dependentiae bacterium]
MENKIYHKSVLVNEVLQYLNPQPNKIYIDATFGGGGHTNAILEKEPNCKVIALDWDKNAINKNFPKLKEKFGDRISVLWGNFANIKKLLETEKIVHVDGILADFGTSQHQIEFSAGFSFQKDTPLDMRMSQAHHYFKASDIVNRFREKELADIIFKYGEERYARRIAKAIVEQRKITKFATTGQLAKLIESVVPRQKTYTRKFYTHPATKTFQALRIFVNKELENIEIFLKDSLNILNINGNMVCISFHSLEDRIVKNFFRENKNYLEILTKKPIIATDEERQKNPSSRSAKLRAVKKNIF